MTANGVTQQTGPSAALGQPAQGAQIPPLVVSGLVVTKADLVRALALYLPHLVDVDQIDTHRFVLTVDAARPHAQGVPHV